MPSGRQGVRWMIGPAVTVALVAAAVADTYTTGQSVEVREGDVWSPATVTEQGGGKYHVHYIGGTSAEDEWVTGERLRATSTPTAGQQPPPPPPPPKPTAKPRLAFSVKDHVEAKWGGTYRKATVLNTRNGWYFISYDGFTSSREWVESDRVRTIGSTADPIGYAEIHDYNRGDGPPAGPSTVAEREAAKASPPAVPGPTVEGRHGRRIPPPVADTDSAAATPPEDIAGPDATHGPGGAPLVKPDLSAGHDLELSGVGGGTVPPDADVAGSYPRMVSLNHGPPKFGTKAVLLTCPQGRFAVMGFRGYGAVTQAQRIDLGNNDADKVVPLASDVQVLAISPDGKRLVTRSDRQGDAASRWRVDLWAVEHERPKCLFSFRAYDPAADGVDGVEWATYPDAAHLLTCSNNHVVTLWAIADAGVKEVYSVAGDGTLRPRLSGGGRYVVAGAAGQLVVFDALTGHCVARANDPECPGDGLGLRADVRRLALSGGRRLVVVDLEHDATIVDIGLPPDAVGDEVAWVTPELLLIDSQYLFDVDHRHFVWEYQRAAGGDSGNGETVAHTVGNRIWLLLQSGGRGGVAGRAVLSSAVVPDRSALLADKHLGEGGLAVRPPATVSLEVSVAAATDDDRRRLVERFTKQLADAGYTVADGQPAKLSIRTYDGKTKTQTFRQVQRYFSPFMATDAPTETLSATQTVYDVSWVINGKPMWTITSTSGGVLPGFIWHKDDQTYQDQVAAMNKPNLGWFLQQHVPRELLTTTDPAGTSGLTGSSVGARVRNNR